MRANQPLQALVRARPSRSLARTVIGVLTLAARPWVTDPESQIMKTSTEGFQQCYNAQTVIDEPMRLPVGAGALAQDVGDLQRRPASRRWVGGKGHRSGPGGTRELQQVQWGRGGRGLVHGQVQVAHRRADGGMPEPALDDG